MKVGVVVFLSIVSFLGGCSRSSEILNFFDSFYFNRTGKLLFTKGVELTTKEVHLNNGDLAGKNLLLKGEIVQIGDYNTYFIMVDESGRMLVLTTKLSEEDFVAREKQKVIVWGILDRGKKGLPFLLAQGVKKIR